MSKVIKGTLVGAVALVLISCLVLWNSSNHLNTVQNDKIQLLQGEVARLNNQLAKYEQIEDGQLLELCIEKARGEYSEYIADNSNKVTHGNVISYYPDSLEVLKIANNNLEKSESNCREKIGD